MNLPLNHQDPGWGASGVSPSYTLRQGTTVRIGPPGSPLARTFTFDRRMPRSGSSPSQALFLEAGSLAPMPLTDEAIGFLARAGEFEVTFDPAAPLRPLPPPDAILTEEQRAYRDRCHAYASACLAVGPKFAWSAPALKPTIEKVAKERGETPPCANTVMAWIRRWQALNEEHGTNCYLKAGNRGNRAKTVVTGLVERALQYGVNIAVQIPKGTAEQALHQAREWLGENYPGIEGAVIWPSIRQIQRLMAMNKFERDYLNLGPEAAARKHKNSYERPRPIIPLEEVDCDHTTLGVQVVDVTRQVLFGRPDLIAFRERCCGPVLGYSVGFEAPSYASFLEGLKHAIYPKDLSAYPGIRNPFFAHGKFKRLYVDNALHFLGDNIRNAGDRIGFELAEFRPRSPWLKGAEERLMGMIDKTVHQLPGSTMSNIEERKRYLELARMPVVTLPELIGFLNHHFCDIHNVSPHVGLGPLRTMKGVPRQLWESMIGQVTIPLPPPESTFAALAGDVDDKAVTDEGVRWENIRYQAAELILLRTHYDHRPGRAEEPGSKRFHPGTKYRVSRNPMNLGRIWVTNPYDVGPKLIEAQAVRSDYAEGLTLHQHRVNMANAAADLKAMVGPEEELMRAKARVTALVVELLEIREKQGVQRKLARYLYNAEDQHIRSVVSARSWSEAASGEFMDPRDPVEVPRPTAASPDAVQPTGAAPPPPGVMPPQVTAPVDGMPAPVDPGAKPMEAARKRRARRETPHMPDASDLDFNTNPEWDDT